MGRKKIAVFISGRGSNFKAILDEVKKGSINGEIVAVISDNPAAGGLQYAQQNGIDTHIFEKHKQEPRSEYFQKIISLLEKIGVDVVVLAGFMKVLSKNVVERYRNRILNIHPALLPAFPGENAQKQALDYGVKYSGATVHFVDEQVDSGPIILQEVVPVMQTDDEQSLSDRILEKEHIIFPRAVKLICEDRMEVRGRRVFIN
ncbi:MAG: phosphoribosylglycinamide formyltransferase [Spirochaetota bacterium]